MSDIWVAPEHGGKAVGSELVRALEEQFRNRGFGEATIRVSAENRQALGHWGTETFCLDGPMAADCRHVAEAP
ncbi:GNAT family N-acetyltransferase [Sinorhizobium meliloti]|uniref:GNAT family N-acetyltransferase n=1 Tax=Rhizobium meliloti TaxID=382 RepID=UPI003C6EC5C7